MFCTFDRGVNAPRQGGRLRPIDIGLMVAGFVVYWPLGLAVLAAKFWQRSLGVEGDVVSFLRERLTGAQSWANGLRFNAPWGEGVRHTDNAAFDDWRRTELDRLAAERRKLADAERDFAAYMDGLRRARDRDEFDAFMRARNGSNPAS